MRGVDTGPHKLRQGYMSQGGDSHLLSEQISRNTTVTGGRGMGDGSREVGAS